MSQRLRRIQAQYKEMKARKIKEFEFLQENKQTGHFLMLIHGPPNSPYEGCAFRLQIILPKDYPFDPPKIKFIDPIWNPFVDFKTGQICCDILSQNWSPAQIALVTVPLSLISLIAETTVQLEGLNVQATFDMRKNYDKFFIDAKRKANNHCFMKKNIYEDEIKPPNFVPEQEKMSYKEYMKEKHKFYKDPHIKTIIEFKKKGLQKYKTSKLS